MIGISLPVIFVIIISVFVFLPAMFINPEHNFIYSNQRDYYYDYYGNNKQVNYYISNGHITASNLPTTTAEMNKPYPKLYLYDVKNDTTKEISIDEAKVYLVDPGPSSPDGYTVKYQSNNSGIFELFGSNGRSSGYVISKGGGSKNLTGLYNTGYDYYYGSFKLIGWVK